MLKKYFEDALLMEKEGLTLYTTLSSNAKNPLSKKLFESLAEQEQEHIDTITKYLNKDIMIYSGKSFDPLEECIRQLFVRLGKETIGKDLSQIDGLEKAMEMEKTGYKLYGDALKRAKTDAEKKFLKKIMSMEEEHYEALANVHYYYTQNGDWLEENESKVWNWMNI